jgi:hypothetical protein
MNCCERPNKCKRGRDCPARIERIRLAKRLLDQDRPNIPLLLIGRLALGAIILLAILVGSMYADAVRTVA